MKPGGKSENRRMTAYVPVRMLPAERDALFAAARIEGVSVGEYIRRRVLPPVSPADGLPLDNLPVYPVPSAYGRNRGQSGPVVDAEVELAYAPTTPQGPKMATAMREALDAEYERLRNGRK